MTNEIARSDSPGQPAPKWENLPERSTQNPTGVDFSVLCEGCEFLRPDGGCKRGYTNKSPDGEGATYRLTIWSAFGLSSRPTMAISLEGTMKSYQQAREVLKKNPDLRRNPQGEVFSLDESLRIDNSSIVEAERKLRRARRLWSNPVGWFVNVIKFPQEGFIGEAENKLEAAMESTPFSARGTDVGIAVLSQVVRLNCARVNRAKVDNKNLAKQIETGQNWVIGNDELLNPEDLQ